LGGVRVGLLTTLGVGVGFFCPTPKVKLDHFLHHTPELGNPVEMVQFLLNLLLKQIFLAVHDDLNSFQQPNFIPFMLRSLKFWKGWIRESELGIWESVAVHF